MRFNPVPFENYRSLLAQSDSPNTAQSFLSSRGLPWRRSQRSPDVMFVTQVRDDFVLHKMPALHYQRALCSIHLRMKMRFLRTHILPLLATRILIFLP